MDSTWCSTLSTNSPYWFKFDEHITNQQSVSLLIQSRLIWSYMLQVCLCVFFFVHKNTSIRQGVRNTHIQPRIRIDIQIFRATENRNGSRSMNLHCWKFKRKITTLKMYLIRICVFVYVAGRDLLRILMHKWFSGFMKLKYVFRIYSEAPVK